MNPSAGPTCRVVWQVDRRICSGPGVLSSASDEASGRWPAGRRNVTPANRDGSGDAPRPRSSSGVAVGPCRLGDQAGDGRRLGHVDGVAAGGLRWWSRRPARPSPALLAAGSSGRRSRSSTSLGSRRTNKRERTASPTPTRLTGSDHRAHTQPNQDVVRGADRALAALIGRGPSASSVHQARKLIETPAAGIATSRTSPKAHA
jgi:hypothetical protein